MSDISGNNQNVPTVEREGRAVIIRIHEAVVASTREALLLREKGHRPVYYIPKEQVEMAFLQENGTKTAEDDKGSTQLWSITASGGGHENAAWILKEPKGPFAELAGYIGFDPEQVSITVD